MMKNLIIERKKSRGQRGKILSSIKGFTIIELLVVSVIIAILAMILIPSVTAVRAKAQQAKCASNLRAVSSTAMLFSNDNNGDFHSYIITNFDEGNPLNSPTSMDAGLAHYLQLPNHPGTPGVSVETVLTCPVANDLKPANDSIKRTYTPNREATSDHRTLSRFKKRTFVAEPSQMAYLMDGVPYVMTGDNEWYYALAGRSGYISKFMYPHDGKMNVVFVDGHVEALTESEIQDRASGSSRTFWIGE